MSALKYSIVPYEYKGKKYYSINQMAGILDLDVPRFSKIFFDNGEILFKISQVSGRRSRSFWEAEKFDDFYSQAINSLYKKGSKEDFNLKSLQAFAKEYFKKKKEEKRVYELKANSPTYIENVNLALSQLSSQVTQMAEKIKILQRAK